MLLPLLAPCCRLRGEQGASLLLGHACRFARLAPAQLGACRCHTTAARHGGPRRCTAIITAHTACGLPLLAAHSAAPAACHVAAAKSGTNASGATQRPRLTFGDTFCRVIPRRSSRHPHPTPPPRFCCVRTRHSVVFGVSCSLARGPHGTRSALGQQGPTRRLEAHAILLLPTAALCCTRPATMPSQRTRTMVHVALAVAVVAFVARQLQHDREAFVAQLCTWTSAAVVVAAVLLLAAVHLLVDNWSALFGTVEEGLEKHGGQLVASVLKEHGSWTVCSVIDRAHVSCGPHARLPHAPPCGSPGVKFLFTLVGGHISPILVSAKAQGIRVIDVRHEVNAVFAADAVARLTGVPGVAAVTAGPGLTNTITAVKNAEVCCRCCRWRWCQCVRARACCCWGSIAHGVGCAVTHGTCTLAALHPVTVPRRWPSPRLSSSAVQRLRWPRAAVRCRTSTR